MGSMSKPMVRCRCCGHQIRGKEIMRTDLYEREPGRTYVYVKFRCRRCKRMGQTFVPEDRWDWSFLEPARDELSDAERDRLHDAGPISDAELIDFHLRLKRAEQLSDVTGIGTAPERKAESRDAKNREAGRDIKNREPGRDGKNHNSGGRDARLNANGEIRPDDFPAGS